jgi:hypothetical protein
MEKKRRKEREQKKEKKKTKKRRKGGRVKRESITTLSKAEKHRGRGVNSTSITHLHHHLPHHLHIEH